VACAVALDLAGKYEESEKAYHWLSRTQNPDGSWYYSYLDGQPRDTTKDVNYSTYVATGVWCHYLTTGDVDFLKQMWPSIEKAIKFAMTLRQPGGEIYWAYAPSGEVWKGALMAASCCTWQNIRSSITIASILGLEKPEWDAVSNSLFKRILEHPEIFDNFGKNQNGSAMSWYYPVLSGLIEGNAARQQISSKWDDFIMEGWGCKCVVDKPWVTAAETCELILVLNSIGETEKAESMMEWLLKLRDSDDGFWAGIKLPEEIIWPEEKTTWTSAGVILAATSIIQQGVK
jgi:hypothetical protein